MSVSVTVVVVREAYCDTPNRVISVPSHTEDSVRAALRNWYPRLSFDGRGGFDSTDAHGDTSSFVYDALTVNAFTGK